MRLPNFRYIPNTYLPCDLRAIKVAGLAHPGTKHVIEHCDALSKQDIGIVISLDDSDLDDLHDELLARDIEHISFPIDDWTPPDNDTFDQIYQMLQEAAKQGKNVAIHCMAGDGRTGTQLTAIVMRGIMETMHRFGQIFKQDFTATFINDATARKASVIPSYIQSNSSNESSAAGEAEEKNDPVACSHIVSAGVKVVRELCIPLDGGGDDDTSTDSVETAEELDRLCEYQMQMVRQLNQWPQAAPSVDETLDVRFFAAPAAAQTAGPSAGATAQAAPPSQASAPAEPAPAESAASSTLAADTAPTDAGTATSAPPPTVTH